MTEFTRMVARLLAAAPVSHFDTILGGLAALKDELNWLHYKTKEGDLNHDVGMQETNYHYCKFMESLVREDHAVQKTAL